MRLWSIDFKYLDRVGLVALWREALLARAVLSGKTKGYRSHPQLERFLMTDNPADAIDSYICYIYQESIRRGYDFDSSKVRFNSAHHRIDIQQGQIAFEFEHLLKKIKVRDVARYIELAGIKKIESNKMFRIINGGIEKWEKLKQ